MFPGVIVSSLLLTAFANGLVIRRDDDSYPSSSSLSLPTVSPQPILLPDPSFSLSLPPLSPTSTGFPSSSSPPSSLPSVVTKTVYVTQCSSTPTPGPSSVKNDLGTQPTPITLPQATPLNLPPVRRDDNSDSVVAQLRALEQQVMSTYVSQGKGDVMLTVIGKIENLIAQAVAPGADLNSILQQAQDVVDNP